MQLLRTGDDASELDDRRAREGDPSGAGRVRRYRDALAGSAPRASSGLAALLGLLALVDAIGPEPVRDLSTDLVALPAAENAATDAIVAVAGFLLLRIAAGLRRRKITEHRLALGASLILCVADALRGPRAPVEFVVAALLALLLVVGRGQFRARSSSASRWLALRVGLQFALFALAAGTVMLYVPGRVPRGTTFMARVSETAHAMVGVTGSLAVKGDRFTDSFFAVVFGLSLTAVLTAVLLAVRPPTPRAHLTAEDEQRLRALLAVHGSRDSLGYFALRRDKSIVWSPSGKAGVTFRIVNGVALVSGDPIGDPEAWPGAITAFCDHVEAVGCIPAVTGCGERAALAFERGCGLQTLALGDEAVVDPSRFTLDGRAMRGVRQACARIRRSGCTIEVSRVRDIDPAQAAHIRAAADAWRTDAVERGYSMALSRMMDSADGDCVIVQACQDGRLVGVLHFVPWGPDGLSLDTMRRDRHADNGLNEAMIVALCEWGRAAGLTRVSLNFAMFRDTLERGGRVGAGPVAKGTRSVLMIASRWWQIDSLYRFNKKFEPTWVARFISFPRYRDLPRVILANLEAEAFLTRPARWQQLMGHGPAARTAGRP